MSTLPESIRREVFVRANHSCEYCQTSRRIIGMPLVVDHILPIARHGSDELDNLCAACYRCNEFKNVRTTAFDPESGEVVPLYNPRTALWNEHFIWTNGGTHIVGQTAVGRATVIALRLNNDYVVESRTIWVAQGWHPPL